MAILPLTSRVHAVTVFRSGALVTRRAALVRGPDGYPASVRLAGLPLALNDASLRARIEVDQAGEVPVATGLRVALDVPEAGAPLEPPADATIQDAKRAVLRLAARRDQLSAEIDALAKLGSPARPAGKEGEPPPPVPTAARLELIAFRHDEMARLEDERRHVADELVTAEELLHHLEDRRARASTARPARENELRKSVLVDLAALDARAETAWLDVEYQVPGARWLPAYALEMDADLARARLSVRALVTQATGEDWPGVALKLSTADAQAWSELPELTSLRIGRRQASRKRGWVPPPTGSEELYADYDRAMKPPEPVAPPAAAPPPPPRIPSPAKSIAPPTLAGARMSMETLGSIDMAERIAYEPTVAMAAAPPAGAGAMRRARASAPAQFSRPPAGPRMEEPPSDELRPETELLAYARLRMAGPASDKRGKLRPIGLHAQYTEVLAQLNVTVAGDLTEMLNHAAASAREAKTSVPARYFLPQPVDGFDYAYAAEFPLDVPSDGELHGVTLALRDAGLELKHVCVPRESADVFRVVAMTNPLDAPLLPGPVDVSVGGEFQLSAPLRTVPPRGKLELGLGTEPAIKVARNTRYREETGGLMSTNLALEHEIAIEVINHLQRRALVEVRERVPVAKDGDDAVSVALGAVAPPWKDHAPVGQDLKGGHAWHLAIEPGESAKVRATYTIHLAAKNEIVGGNRREA